MTCREVSEFLLEYVSGGLPGHVEAEFHVHLSACDNCVVFVQQYRHAVTLGRTILDESEMNEVPEDLIRAIVSSLRNAD